MTAIGDERMVGSITTMPPLQVSAEKLQPSGLLAMAGKDA
jgi:hypothetical protein